MSAHLAAINSAPFGEPPWSSTNVGVLVVGLVELVPDQTMIIELEAAGEGDLGAGWQEHLVLGAAAGGEEVATVDDGRGQIAVADFRPRARPPG